MTVGVSTVNVADPWNNCIRAGGATRTVVAGTFVKLHIGDPGAAGAGNPSAGTTTRVAVAETASSAGVTAMTGTQPVFTNGAATETISHISVWDAITVGNFLYSVLLTVAQPWIAGNTFTLNTLGRSIVPLAA